MIHWILLTLFSNIGPAMSAVSVNKIVLRTPKEGDIGLIFDINLINTALDEKELLDYRIRPENDCCVNLTEKSMADNVGKIVGGSFGQIEPGAMQTVSVIWSTTILFNRVGYCDIIISSTNVKNEEKQLSQRLQFDTRFTTIDGSGSTFKRRQDYKECSNWDMNFLNNCTPFDCQEKYLGSRSFYNKKTQMCEPAAKCTGANLIYDMYANECLDVTQVMNAEDIEDIKKGKCENNSWDQVANNPQPENVQIRSLNHNDFRDKYPRHNEEKSLWPAMIAGFSIVFATIFVYTSVCFVIFLLVNWLSKASASTRSAIIVRNQPQP